MRVSANLDPVRQVRRTVLAEMETRYGKPIPRDDPGSEMRAMAEHLMGSGGGAQEEVLERLSRIEQMVSKQERNSAPLLTKGEAADLIGISPKRFENIVSEEKRRLGRLPDWICNARGNIRHHVVRDEFLDWVRQRKRKRGRPRKTQG